MAMTIKKLAESLGVSKTAIRKHMSEDFRSRYTKTRANGVINISSSGCRFIATIMGRELVVEDFDEVETSETSETKELSQEREAWYQDQIRRKDEIIDSLMAENKEIKDKLLELSGQVGDTLTAITKGQLADKLIEGQKAMNEVAIGSDGKKHWWQKIGKNFHG